MPVVFMASQFGIPIHFLCESIYGAASATVGIAIFPLVRSSFTHHVIPVPITHEPVGCVLPAHRRSASSGLGAAALGTSPAAQSSAA